LSEEADMVSSDLPHFLVIVALAAVAIVLLLGLWNMMRGGSANRSQTLMRWRVILQFIAIILIMGTLWIMGR
jgi:heme/copper-type cytochrome/quinol oxidase subunit 4